jgi:hypothetical protein
MALGGDGNAMDKQPGQRQCDCQQQPCTQPPRQENPHGRRPSFFPSGGSSGSPAAVLVTWNVQPDAFP